MPTDYDVAVIGGGAAGLAAAGISAYIGARTLLVERNRLGGECTWTGCVPSKTLLRSAGAVQAVKDAGSFGISTGECVVDFGAVMSRVRAVQDRIYERADSPEIYSRMGVDVQHGTARFLDAHTLEVAAGTAAQRVTARSFIIATGSEPSIPDIPGIDDVEVLTNETVFKLEERPGQLVVIGAGASGLELGQAFGRLGSAVTLIEAGPRILPKDDAESTDVLRAILESEGLRFVLNAEIASVRRKANGVLVQIGSSAVYGDVVLVAAGRSPRVHGFGLDAAGIAVGPEGIVVNDRCRTSVSHIYAIGDVTGRSGFTHTAEHMARVAVMNALLKYPSRLERVVPRVAFTDPEFAQVGVTEVELREEGRSFEVFRFPYKGLDRAVTDRTERGLVKTVAGRRSGKILGATIVGARAGDLICELSLAIRNGISLRNVSDTIHPYPTFGLAVRRAADQWYARRRSPRLVKILKAVFGYRGPVVEIPPDEVL